MKPVTLIVSLLLALISVGHVLRLLFKIEVIVNGFHVPLWISFFGCIVPALLALLLWREARN
ncbi:MAG: hypothetical protein PHR77_22140 [Kiritimatiellae bacterium]|nr:hypothetical protein [Kiritimatiellia bacterium]MDD5520442.1 hypothetical protein [Kiritimatiellia bacterium]